MKPLTTIIEKLLEEVDPDIKEIMLTTSEDFPEPYWYFLIDPANLILKWQSLRDRQKD